MHVYNDYPLRYGHKDVVELLLNHGADVHACNDQALRWAAENGHTQTVSLLLEHGADKSVLDSKQNEEVMSQFSKVDV